MPYTGEELYKSAQRAPERGWAAVCKRFCKIYAAFVLIKILSLRINSEQQKEAKHVRINLEMEDATRKNEYEAKQLYAIYAVVSGSPPNHPRPTSHTIRNPQPTHKNKLRVRWRCLFEATCENYTN